MPRYPRVCRLIGLLLLICATGPSDALKCPGRRSSPGREITCFTRSSDPSRLEEAICQCTSIVHQGHDLRSLDASELKDLRSAAKEANSNLKVMMSVSDKYELLKDSAITRKEVLANLTRALKDVDGVELNVTSGNSKDRLVSFIKDLRHEIASKGLEKTILLELPTKPEKLAKQFELKELSKYVDVFTVSTHYLKDKDEDYRTFHPSRLMGLFDMLNTDSLVDLISGMGAPKHKILISVPASAYRFTLKNPDNNTPRSLAANKGPQLMDRKKLCEAMSSGDWTVERDEDLTAPYAFKNTTWIAFEDEISLKIKSKYVILRELLGLGLRDVEKDFKTNCGKSLVQSIHKSFSDMKRKTRAVILSSLEKDLKGTESTYPRHVRSSDFRIVRVVDTEGKIRAVRENTQTAFTCSRQGYFVHPKSCNRFYRCVKFNQDVDDYSVFEFDCPAGLAFDERTEVCVWPGSVSKGSACPGSSEIEPVSRTRFRCPSQPGFYADTQNCRWFFACYDLGGPEMVPYEFRCPFGLVFDEHNLICEWPWKVPNCNSPEYSQHSTYNYGNYDALQKAYAAQGRIVNNGLLTQYPGQGADHVQNQFTSDKYNTNGIYNAFNGQIYNGTGAFDLGTGSLYDGLNYNQQGSSGVNIGNNENNYNSANGGYQENNYNNAGGVISGGVLNSQDNIYNTNGPVNPLLVQHGQTYYPVNNPQGGLGFEPNYNDGNAGGTGVNYDSKIYDTNANVKPLFNQNGQIFNPGLGGQTGLGYEHNYNTNGIIGADYNGNVFNVNNGVNSLLGQNGQIYPAIDPREQEYKPEYNTALGTGSGLHSTNADEKPVVVHLGQAVNPVRGPDTGVGYNGHDYNTGSNYDQNIYNKNGVKPSIGQNRNIYIPAKPSESGVEDTSNFNSGPALSPGEPSDKWDHNTNYNKQSAGGQDGHSYSGFDAASEAGKQYYGYNYNTDGTIVAGVVNNGQENNLNTYGYKIPLGYLPGEDPANCDKKQEAEVPVPEVKYNDDHHLRPSEGGFNHGQQDVYSGPGYHYPVYNNPEILYGPSVPTSIDHSTKGIIKPDDCDNKSSTPVNHDNKHKQSTIFSNDGLKTTQFNSGGLITTTETNNFNQGTHATAGFTDSPTNFADESISTKGYTTENTNAYAKDEFTDFVTGTTYGGPGLVTSGYASNTGFTGNNGPIDQFSNTDLTKINEAVTNNFNAFDSTTKSDAYGGTGGVVNIGNTEYGSTVGQKLYNSTYNAAAGFPTSTIIPFLANQNTFDTEIPGGSTPINSTGLASTESFGNEYTNEAEKSFTPSGQTSRGFTAYGQNQNGEIFNTPTNVYDYSRVNLDDGVTPAITVVRDGQNENTQDYVGGTNYGGSTYTTANYDRGVLANGIGNSPFIGQSIPSTNSKVTKFSDSTNLPFNGDGNTATNFIQSSGSYSGSTLPTVQPASNGPEVELDNSGLLFGVKIGTSTTPGPGGLGSDYPSTVTPDTGYKIHENYAENADRGTVKYNNGLVANKAGENDIQDYRSSGYTSLPNSFIISSGVDLNDQSTIQKPSDADQTQGVFTKEGFTKTGPTKTGITTAQVGGSGSYVIGSNAMRRKPNPQYIGEQAFSGNFGVKDNPTNPETTVTSPASTNSELLKFTATTEGPEFTGYSYPRPSAQGRTSLPSDPAHSGIRPLGNRNSVIIQPSRQNNGYFGTAPAVLDYTTNHPLQRFRSTLQDIGTLSQTISTVKPEIEAEFGIEGAASPGPGGLVTQRQSYQPNLPSTNPNTYLDFGVSFNPDGDYISTIQGSTGSSDYSDITSNFDQGNFGQKIAGKPILSNVNYQQPTTNAKPLNRNSQLIKSTESDYDFYTQAKIDSAAQSEILRSNQPISYISTTVNLPSSTRSPLADNTFRKPIVAAEFSENRLSGSSRGNSNSANYRILSNQASAGFSQDLSSKKLLANQAIGPTGLRGPSATFLNNQPSSNINPQELNARLLINQAYPSTVFERPSGRLINKQNSRDFGYDRTPSNKLISNNYSPATGSPSPSRNQGFNGQRTLIGSSVITSIGGTDLYNDFLSQNGENLKIISEFDGLKKKNSSGKYQSTTVAPEVTTYTGSYGKAQTRLPSGNQNKKVIVKLSDLHPLILGKLSAECTCKADPFSIFNIPNKQATPIKSQNGGQVDLGNYDEGDVYVDIDAENVEQRDIELIKNIPSSEPIKPGKLQRANGESNDRSVIITSRGEALASDLPAARLSESPITPVYRKNQASLGAERLNRQPLLINVGEGNGVNSPVIPSRRSGKSLLVNQSVKTTNNLNNLNDPNGQGKRSDPYESVVSKSTDSPLKDNLECARPGLFRHPKFCNKFYACHWDNWKKRYALHVFNCPVHLAFDTSAGACNYPSKGPACQDNKLLL